MILSRKSIINNVKHQNIEIQPFNESKVNPNSYTVTLGNKLLVYKGDFVDTAQKNETEEITIPIEGYVLKKNHFYVGHISEYIGSDFFVPLLHAKLNTAKKGLFVHITANLIDIGNHCNFSLQLYPTENIKVYPGMDIAQVSFWKVDGDISLYNGKYKGVRGPASSQSYKHAGK
jgi:dCTP deaminase